MECDHLLIGAMIENKDEQYLRTYLSLGIYLQWPELGWETDASQLYGAFSLSRSFLSVDIPGMEGVGEHAYFISKLPAPGIVSDMCYTRK